MSLVSHWRKFRNIIILFQMGKYIRHFFIFPLSFIKSGAKRIKRCRTITRTRRAENFCRCPTIPLVTPEKIRRCPSLRTAAEKTFFHDPNTRTAIQKIIFNNPRPRIITTDLFCHRPDARQVAECRDYYLPPYRIVLSGSPDAFLTSK